MTPGGAWRIVGRDGDVLRVDRSLPMRVELVERVETVPLAPREIVGVAETAGRVVTLLDPELVADASAAGATDRRRGLAVLLAPPLDHLALFVPAGSRLEPPDPDEPASGEVPPPLDRQAVERLVARLTAGSTR